MATVSAVYNLPVRMVIIEKHARRWDGAEMLHASHVAMSQNLLRLLNLWGLGTPSTKIVVHGNAFLDIFVILGIDV